MNSNMNPVDWRDWEDSLDTIGSPGPFEMDLGFDNFLLTAADDFAEPFALSATANANVQQHTHAAPHDAPGYNALHHPHQQQYQLSHQQQQQQPFQLHDEDEELLALADAEVFVYEQEQGGVLSEHTFKCESIVDLSSYSGSSSVNGNSSGASVTTSTAKRTQRKRKSTDMTLQHQPQQHIKEEPIVPSSPEKKLKSTQQPAKLDEQAERLYRRRYDILHEILEAWNTGGIEDMEEIADSVYDDDVTLISPDYTDGLRGVQAIMNHWNTLLDAFPDGIMEEYEIQREDAHGEKIKATWVFSGTQIFPFFGVEPRHEKVCISGTSFFSFKGDKIQQVVLSWNYREALMKLMGVAPSKAVPGQANHISPAAAAQMAQILAAHR
ncbi:hypothetical protein Gpo141_00007799 [Globisporangium polare]